MRSLSKYFTQFTQGSLAHLKKNQNFFSFLSIFSLILLLKLFFLNLPAYWDEQSYLNGAITVFKNNLNPFIDFFSYKPPLLFELTAVLYRIFGYSLWISRLVIAFFASLAVYFTFLLGEFLYDRRVGLLAAILLLFFPVFFTQSGLFQLAVPVTALTVATVYSYLNYFKTKKWWSYFISASLLVLSKEVAVLIIASILLYDLIVNRKKCLSQAYIRRALFFASPLLFFVLWMVLNRIIFGWFLWPCNLSSFVENIPCPTVLYDVTEFKEIISMAFWMGYRKFVSLIILTGFLASILSKNKRVLFIRKEMILIFLLFSLSILFFWLGPFLPRYILYFYPFYFILAAAALVSLLKKQILYFLVALVLVIVFIINWQYCRLGKWAGEIDSCYLDILLAHKELAEFLESDFPSYKVLAAWPLNPALKLPEFGFVKEPLGVISLERYLEEFSGEAVLIPVSKYCYWHHETRAILGFINQEKPILIRTFTRGDEAVFLYFLPEEPS